VDDPLCEYARSVGIHVFRGELEDVASRVLRCALQSASDYFIRLNGDSPFVDPTLVEAGIALCLDTQPDLVTNLIGRTFPYGISVEILRTATFGRLYARFTQPEDREHLTRYLYSHPEEVNIQTLISPDEALKKARLVVDTEEDWQMFEKIVLGLESRYGRQITNRWPLYTFS
jgi:spore coat polysaccharide biosynthesis protein SpsF